MTSPEHGRDWHRLSPSKEKLDPLAQKVAELEQKLAAVTQVKELHPEIDRVRADTSTMMPSMESYNGIGDPYDHTHVYDRLMHYYDHSDVTKCQIFVKTLKKGARLWMTSLPPSSIDSWKELCDKF